MIFKHKIDELLIKLELLRAVGDPQRFTEASEALYGRITSGIVSQARDRRKSNARIMRESGESYSSQEARDILQSVFDRYGLSEWKVRIKRSLVTSCSAGKKSTLFIKDGYIFTQNHLDRIITHEIETHIFTAENGKLQPYKIFNIGLAGYLETQEGLAIYAQEQKNFAISYIHGWSAISVLATAAAYETSFAEVYKKLVLEGLNSAKAFRLALRVKRGLTDTGQKGAFTKELMYFSGAQKINKFGRGRGDIRKLFIGKVAMKDIPFLSKIPNLAPPKYLPEWVALRP